MDRPMHEVFDQFKHQRAETVRFLQTVNGGDVRMVQGGKRLRLSRKIGRRGPDRK